jgi:hypothetical protein
MLMADSKPTTWSFWSSAPAEIAASAKPGDHIREQRFPLWAWTLLSEALATRKMAAVSFLRGRVVMPIQLLSNEKLLRRLARGKDLDVLSDLLLDFDADHLIPDDDRKALAQTVVDAAQPDVLDQATAQVTRRKQRPTLDTAKLGTYQAAVLRALAAIADRALSPIPVNKVACRLPEGPPTTNAQRAALSRALRALANRGFILLCGRGKRRYIRSVEFTEEGWAVAKRTAR